MAISARWNGEVIDLTASAEVALADFGIEQPASQVVTVADTGMGMLTLDRLPGSPHLIIRGQIPAKAAPFVRTAPFTYVRLRRAVYESAELDAVVARIHALGVEQAFVYFKHEVLGPKYALELSARSA